MSETIFNIPKKIKVGLQERNGTYTGKLGFEFEITIENLLFILEECVSNKGKV